MDVINRGLGAVAITHILKLHDLTFGLIRGLQLGVGPYCVQTGWSSSRIVFDSWCTVVLAIDICYQGGPKGSSHRAIVDNLVG